MGWLIRLFGIALLLSALALSVSRAPDRSVDSLVARWGQPPSQFDDLQGQLVHFRDEGPTSDRVPVVLLHDLADSLHTWDGWAAALHHTRRVVRLDLPGNGLTGPFTGAYAGRTYSAEHLAQFTIDFLDKLKIRRFSVAGNGLGGEVAWRIAAMAPDRVAALVLVDATGYGLSARDKPLATRLARLPLAGMLGDSLLPRSLIESSLAEMIEDPRTLTPELIDRRFEMVLREGNRAALIETVRSDSRGRDADMIKTVRAPTLILWGAHDQIVPPEAGVRFEQDIAGSQRVNFERLGHLPQEEAPADTVVPVDAFLPRR